MTNQAVDILLVEDDVNDAELALYTLKKHHLANSIQIVRDGAEALAYLFGLDNAGGPNANPRVIFLDLKLPKVDGVEVLRRIKNDDRTKNIPVVVMTSSREECDVLQTYDLGVNSYVVKPIDFGQFSEAVLQLGFYWLLLNHHPILQRDTR